jgi:hypothetical protein
VVPVRARVKAIKVNAARIQKVKIKVDRADKVRIKEQDHNQVDPRVKLDSRDLKDKPD